MTRLLFEIPVGDWSNDGHGKCTWFRATANATDIEEVRAAYFAAEKAGHAAPTDFVKDYQANTVTAAMRARLKEASGIDLADPDDLPAPGDVRKVAVGMDEFLAYIIWFINQGNPSLDVRADETRALPMLPFFGFDAKKRHISSMGYGLFAE